MIKPELETCPLCKAYKSALDVMAQALARSDAEREAQAARPLKASLEDRVKSLEAQLLARIQELEAWRNSFEAPRPRPK